MNCREAEQLISVERDEALDASGRADLEAHLAACPHCRQMRHALTAVAGEWRTEVAAVRVPNADLEWRRLQNRMRQEAEPRPRSYARWFGIPVALTAAAAAVAVYIGTGEQPVGETSDRSVARAAGRTASPSTVVYTDDSTGWTFVWSNDASSGQAI